MTAPDLISLIDELKDVDLRTGLDLALDMRRIRRNRFSQRSRKGAETKRANFRANDAFKGERL